MPSANEDYAWRKHWIERSGYRDYNDYVHRDHWKQLRQECEEYHGSSDCSVCGQKSETGPRNDLHHLTYRRMGNERPEDLVFLCRYHHSEVYRHGKANGSILSIWASSIEVLRRHQQQQRSETRWLSDFSVVAPPPGEHLS